MNTFAYSRVIVGTDGSVTATEAVRRMSALAAAIDATLRIVSVYDRRVEDPRPASERAQLPGEQNVASGYRAAIDIVQDAAALARASAAGVSVDTDVAEGDAAEQLLKVAQSETAAVLLAVGNRGMTGSARFLLGSVPNTITHHATGDVLVVRTGQRREAVAPKRLVIATDGSTTADRAVRRGLALAAALGAHATLFTVGDDERGRAALEAAGAKADALGVTWDPLLRDGDPAEEIIAAGAESDLLVLGNRGMTGAARFLGSVPNKVSHHATTDLLIVKTD